MIDFQSGGLFARLKKVADNAFGDMISDFLIAGETIVGTYQGVRDGVVKV